MLSRLFLCRRDAKICAFRTVSTPTSNVNSEIQPGRLPLTLADLVNMLGIRLATVDFLPNLLK